MSDFDSGFDAVRRADRVIDALATERRVPSNDPGDLAVASLLAHWRDDIRRGPVPDLVSTRQAAVALTRSRKPHRNRFLPTVVGAVAAAMLCLGGFGAVLYDAHPGDALYGLRTLVFGQSPLSRNQQVALAAQSQLMEVQQLIQQGQWNQAQDKLATASTAVQGVPDLDRKQALIDQMNQLTVKVAARDPNVSLPPGAPPPPPLPGMVVPLPNVVEASPTSSDATTTSTTTSLSTTPSETTTTTPAPVQAPSPGTTAPSATPTTTTATTTAPTTVTTTTPVTVTTTTPVTVTTTTSAAAAGTGSPAKAPAPQGPAVAGSSSAATASEPTTTTEAPAPRSSRGPSFAPAQTSPKNG
jgi:anti-sigma-D factor RsdA-like protein